MARKCLVVVLVAESLEGLILPRLAFNLLCSQGWPWTPGPTVGLTGTCLHAWHWLSNFYKNHYNPILWPNWKQVSVTAPHLCCTTVTADTVIWWGSPALCLLEGTYHLPVQSYSGSRGEMSPVHLVLTPCIRSAFCSFTVTPQNAGDVPLRQALSSFFTL